MRQGRKSQPQRSMQRCLQDVHSQSVLMHIRCQASCDASPFDVGITLVASKRHEKWNAYAASLLEICVTRCHVASSQIGEVMLILVRLSCSARLQVSVGRSQGHLHPLCLVTVFRHQLYPQAKFADAG